MKNQKTNDFEIISMKKKRRKKNVDSFELKFDGILEVFDLTEFLLYLNELMLRLRWIRNVCIPRVTLNLPVFHCHRYVAKL